MFAAALCLLGAASMSIAAETGDPRPAPADAQARARSAAEQTMRQAIFEAEDRRAPTPEDVRILVDGSRHASEDVQRMAVRALGRLERPELIPHIVPLLAAASASVRAEAANALAQVASRVDRARDGEIPGWLLSRLGVERDAAVRGVLCQSIGRVPYSSADAVRRAEAALLTASTPEAGTSATPPMVLVHGVAKGFESLLRRNAKLSVPAPETIRFLRGLILDRRVSQSAGAAEIAAGVRRLALGALTAARQADQDTIVAAAGDPDVQVRRLALLAFGSVPAGAVADDVRGRVIRAGLVDREYMVRLEALRVHGRTLAGAAADWDPVFAALSDPSAHVALLAIDLLGLAQARSSEAVDRLRIEAGSLTSGRIDSAGAGPNPPVSAGPAAWHRAVHALVSLARLAPPSAREMLPTFVASPLWPVRMYGARAAAIVRDENVLRGLAGDSHDNVREAALAGLRTVQGHDADDIYIGALARADYQLVMTAASALEATPGPARSVPALLAALARITAERRDTSRDVRTALLTRIRELGQPADAPALLPYVTDFDPQVAAGAAAVIGKWTGQAPAISPRPLPVERPRLADIERLRSARVVVTMTGRGAFELELLTDEAPATVARFVRLARAGYYDGLTFHRVVPPALLQGGSPGANEFAGDGAYMRDELGLQSHVRGSAGISTRGRDTGDAQIFLDVADNPRWDHDYTVFARVAAGVEVLDRILECDVIERIEVKGVGIPTPPGVGCSVQRADRGHLVVHVAAEAADVGGDRLALAPEIAVRADLPSPACHDD